MRLLPVLFILTSIEAKRRRLENAQDNINRRPSIKGVDVYPEKFGEAVDFGHVYRNEARKEIANVELDMVEPRSLDHARQLLRKVGSDIVKIKTSEEPLGFSNPRDAMQYQKLTEQTNSNKGIGQSVNTKRPLRVKNVTQIIPKSIEEEIKKQYPDHWSHIQEPSSDILSGTIFKENDDNKKQFFTKFGFDLVSDETYYTGNWTTCREFAKKAVFHPDDVINIPWVPFYIWSLRRFKTSIVHTLTYPTKKLVKQYKEQLGPYLNIKIDWDQPKLLLKESNEMLLIAGDRKGLFYGIPHVELPSITKDLNFNLTVIMVRLKIVDPYLAMMYCKENYAVIMSVAGSEPETDKEKTAEAAILEFQGYGKPVSRDLELEAAKAKFEIESKRRQEERKFLKVEKPFDTLDPSLW